MANSSITGPQSNIADRWVRYEDDWSGIIDRRERRRIQNRRNQRTRRSRKRREAEARECDATEGQQLVLAQESRVSLLDSTQQSRIYPESGTMIDAICSVNILDPDSEHNKTTLRSFEVFAYQYYLARSPQITLLPSLSQFNFIRALFANVKALGLSSDQMNDDAISTFNSLGFDHGEPSTTVISRLPAGLRPTALQCVTLHHPWIDLLPVPEMRDNLFRRGFDSFDEDELCHCLRGRIPGHNPGMLVWRDPWDPSGWEVTETFVRSWGWAIAGCWGLFRSTNMWRAQRGEKPLFRRPS